MTMAPGCNAAGGDDHDAVVRVAVRARPLLDKEAHDSCRECISYSPDGHEIALVLGHGHGHGSPPSCKEKRFTFDHVFRPTSSQADIYLDCVKPLVDSCISGYNATVLAYGQTGSGKTHTMGSGNNNGLQEDELGILPRVIRQLYRSIEEQKQTEFLVKCSFVEIYNEEIKDLLHPDTASKSIFIREDANGDIILAGVREEVVTNFDNMMKFLEQGSTFRTTGSTLMNQHSSRSHAIFTIIIEQRAITDCTPDSDIITAKFHLVDLAGSERAKRTGAVGVRFKESITINSGLLALGNVISALGDERKRGQHVPYRQSKLTRILQDSLGGNSRTCMIACISTADINHEETLNTLKYANRARNIRNKPIINRDSRASQINQLRQELKILQEELRSRDEENASDVLLKIQHTDQQEIAKKLMSDLQDSQVTINKLKDKTMQLEMQEKLTQSKFDRITQEMNLLLQMIPSWESSRDISEPPMVFLLQMANRILADDKEVVDVNKDTNCQTGITTTDVLKDTNSQTAIGVEVLKDMQQHRLASPTGQSARREERQSTLNHENCSTDLNKENDVDAPKQSSPDTPSIMKHYLKTIQVLQRKLARRELELKLKNESLVEITNELARDQKIFSEKMHEIKALKKLTKELSHEKECLLQKVQMDATIISSLSHNALANEDELSKLRASIESLQMQAQEPFLASKCEKKFKDSDKREPQKEFVDCWTTHTKNKKEDTKDFSDSERESTNGENKDRLKARRRFTRNFEQRFQDLASLVLKGETPNSEALTDIANKNQIYTTSGYEDEEFFLHEMKRNNGSTVHTNSWWERSTLEVPSSKTSPKNDAQHMLDNEKEISTPETGYRERRCMQFPPQYGKSGEDQKRASFEEKLREVALAWHEEKQVLEDMVEGERKAWEDRAMSVAKRHEQLERDHRSLKEELENTRSLMQKAGLGIRLSLDSVRELSDGDVVELLNPKPVSSSRPKP